MRRSIVAASTAAIITTGPIIAGSPSSAAALAEPDPPISTTQQFAAITADFLGPARQGLGSRPGPDQVNQVDERAQLHRASRGAARAVPAAAIRKSKAVVRVAVARPIEHGYVARHRVAKPAARRAVVHAVVRHSTRTAAHRAARTVKRSVSPVAARRGLGAVVSYAWSKVGHSYQGGAAGPGSFDCSGLVMRAYARIGFRLPHSAAAIAGRGRWISRSAARPGDVVVGPGHVGIYMGGGMMIDAGNYRVGVSYRRMYAGLHIERI